MKKTIAILSGIIVLLLLCLKRCNNEPTILRGSADHLPAQLPQNVVKRVVVDTAKRRLIVQVPRQSDAPAGTNSVDQQILFLPPHATIDFLKSGDVQVTAKPFGFAVDPFLGFGYAERPRLFVGAQLLYFKYLDFGVFTSFDKTNDARFGVEASYNVWRSVDIGLGYDNHQHTSLFLTVKL